MINHQELYYLYVYHGSVPKLETLNLSKVNLSGNDNHALKTAIEKNHLHVIKWLHKVPNNNIDFKEKVMTDLAMKHRHYEIAKYLKKLKK